PSCTTSSAAGLIHRDIGPVQSRLERPDDQGTGTDTHRIRYELRVPSDRVGLEAGGLVGSELPEGDDEAGGLVGSRQSDAVPGTAPGDRNRSVRPVVAFYPHPDLSRAGRDFIRYVGFTPAGGPGEGRRPQGQYSQCQGFVGSHLDG